MAESVGAIYYTVEADTQKLLESVTPTDASVDKLGKTFSRTDRAANAAQFQMTKTAQAVKGLGRESETTRGSLGGLGKVLGGILTIQGVRTLIDMAESYGEMSERVRMATSSAQEYDMVQQRLLANANSTYRTLAESSEVYIRTADSLRAMGYSTEGALDAVDSLSYLFVTNAASAQRADGAISAFTKALNKGRIEADGWETIMAAVPSVVGDIAAASGKSADEIRRMGVEGKLTAQMLTQGLVTSLEKNRDAAAQMATNLKDAFRSFSNNLSVFLGEANNASGATGLLSQAIIGLGENIETVVKLLTVAGAGAMARYLAGLIATTKANIDASIAAQRLAVAELAEARAHQQATAAALAHAQANAGLSGMTVALTRATDANSAALARVAAAQRAAVSAGAGLLGFLGGPVGIVALVASAAAGFVLFGDNAQRAAPKIDELTDSVEKLGAAQLELRRQQAGEAIERLEREALDASRATRGLEKDLSALEGKLGRGVDEAGLSNVRKSLVEQRAEQELVNESLVKAREAQRLLNEEVERRGRAASSGPGSPKASVDPEVQKRLQGLRDEAELAKLSGEARARLQAIQKLGANATKEEREEAERLASEIYRLENAQKASTKGTKESVEAAKENAKALDQMAVALMEAGLQGEALAVAKARANLNKFATPEEIAAVDEFAKALHRVSEAEANRAMLKQLDPIAGAELDFQTQLENLRKLNEAKLIEDQRYLDLKAQAETAHAENMLALQEQNFRAQSQWNDTLMGSLDALGSAGTNAISGILVGLHSGADAARMLGNAVLNEVIGSFVAMGIQYVKSLVMGQAAQTAATASTIAMAGTLATAWTPAATLASLATAGANSGPAIAGISTAMAATQAMSFFGGRQYGGPVGAGKMYRINENGAPEILNTASGRQYLLPNSRGEVVSNKDAAQGTGQAPVSVIIHNAPPGTTVEQRQVDDGTEVNVFLADIGGNGPRARALEQTYGLRRQGR